MQAAGAKGRDGVPRRAGSLSYAGATEAEDPVRVR